MKVAAAYSKRRREDIVPLRSDIARAVAAFLADRPANAPLFAMPKKPALMLRADLKAAGIPYRDKSGRVIDFHALRHTFITRLARSCIAPAVAKSLVRHGTVTLTLDNYTHADQGGANCSEPLTCDRVQ